MIELEKKETAWFRRAIGVFIKTFSPSLPVWSQHNFHDVLRSTVKGLKMHPCIDVSVHLSILEMRMLVCYRCFREISKSTVTLLGCINSSHLSWQLHHISGYGTKAMWDMQRVFDYVLQMRINCGYKIKMVVLVSLTGLGDKFIQHSIMGEIQRLWRTPADKLCSHELMLWLLLLFILSKTCPTPTYSCHSPITKLNH